MNQQNGQASAQEPMIIAYLRRSPGARGVMYLICGASALEVVAHLQDRTLPYRVERLHLTLVPFTAVVTNAFSRLEPPAREDEAETSLRARAAQGVLGALIGAGGIGAVLAAAASQGWVDAPEWGWEQVPVPELARAITFIAVGHLAVAWNEETVYRGYGYTALRQAVPPTVAGAFLTVLFGYGHSFNPQIAWGEAALGLPLMLLRVATGNIWASVGYHWAWNFLQTGIFGPPQRNPSLRPLNLHGPYLWTGKPGLPEPGLLSMTVNLLVAAGIALWMRRRRRL